MWLLSHRRGQPAALRWRLLTFHTVEEIPVSPSDARHCLYSCIYGDSASALHFLGSLQGEGRLAGVEAGVRVEGAGLADTELRTSTPAM